MSTLYHNLGIDPIINDMFLQEIRENDIGDPEIFLKSFWVMISKLSQTDIYKENENEINLLPPLRYVIMRYKNNDTKTVYAIEYGKNASLNK